MKNYIKTSFPFLIIFLIAFSSFQNQAKAQIEHRPYPVYDTKPVIIQDPYLMEPSETAMTVNWMTDTNSHSKVMYGTAANGKLDQVAEGQHNGLMPVGTMHSVRLTGLKPGTAYKYKIASRRVVKLNPYWPEMGKWVESPVYTFTTFDMGKPDVSFSAITDTHEDVSRLKGFMDMINWDETDFLVHTGDAFDWLKNEQQIFNKWLTPITKSLNQSVPLIYARGNHELRGPFARQFYHYVPTHSGNFYFAKDHGPLHLLVMDTGEDKPDTTNVYAGLNRLKKYKKIEYEWFKRHVDTSESLKKASFRIIAMHDPKWGWTGGQGDRWTALANKANIDFVIAGHWHRYAKLAPGEADGNDYPILVLGQHEIAHIDVSEKLITVEVRNTENEVVDSFKIDADGKLYNFKNKK